MWYVIVAILSAVAGAWITGTVLTYRSVRRTMDFWCHLDTAVVAEPDWDLHEYAMEKLTTNVDRASKMRLSIKPFQVWLAEMMVWYARFRAGERLHPPECPHYSEKG